MTPRHAAAMVAAALALGLMPDPVTDPVTWGADHLVLADGPHAGARWDPDVTPYFREPLSLLAADSPHTYVTVRKSAQVGFTNIGIVWIGSIIDQTPARAMVVFPTLSSVQDFNREKLNPTIEATPTLARKVSETRSRSLRASTALSKRYPGGMLTLTGANSAADLRSKTTKFQFRDEIDEWPVDLDGQGDPYAMADARLIAFHATADYKVLEGSTPTIRGASRVDQRFEAGDQRYYHVRCPHCGDEQRLEFGGRDVRHGLKFEPVWPHRAHYVCLNGCIIEHHEKRGMVLAGRWIADKPEPGRHPSFHISALYSLLTTWDEIAARFVAAKDDPTQLKAFVNLWLGESWEERGDAPDWQRLLLRRGDYPRGVLPPGAYVVTTAVDVQKDGIYFETIGWGADLQSWSLDVGFVAFDTSDRSEMGRRLDALADRGVLDAGGRVWKADRIGVDAGYQTQNVYDWVRRHPGALALKGVPGWYRPAIATTPSVQDMTLDGRKIRRGVRLWPIGTWPLKAQIYGDLRKDGARDGAEMNPPGYCHFSTNVHDDAYFRQLTAEHLKDRESRGRVVREWVATGPNHYHDCRVMGRALVEHMGLQRWTPERWQKIATERTPVGEPSLFDVASILPAQPSPAARAAKPTPARATQGGRFFQRRPDFL